MEKYIPYYSYISSTTGVLMSFNRIFLIIIAVAAALMGVLAFVMAPDLAGDVGIGAYIASAGLTYVAVQAGHYASL
jgi:hypothetical protein